MPCDKCRMIYMKNYVPVLSLRLIVSPRNHSTVVPDLVRVIHWYVFDNPELIQNCKMMIKKALTHTLGCLYVWTYQNVEFAPELRLTWRFSWPTSEFNACSLIQIFCSGQGIVHYLKLIYWIAHFFLDDKAAISRSYLQFNQVLLTS